MYQKRRLQGALYGIIPCQDFGVCLSDGPTSVSVPGALKGSQRLASNGTEYATSFKYAGTGVAWRITPDWKLSVDMATSTQDRTNRDSAIFLLDSAGSYQEYQYLGYTKYLYSTAQIMLSGKLQTGPIEHSIAVGGSWMKQTSRYAPNSFIDQALGYGNIYDFSGFTVPRTPLNKHLRNQEIDGERAWFASDTLSFGDHWQALLGARVINFSQDGYDYSGDGARNSHYAKSPITPTYALIYKPVANATIYASYVKSLEAGGSAGTNYKNAGQVFGPQQSSQYELGAKLEAGGWSYSAAAFRIKRALYYTQNGYYLQGGKTCFDGVEFSAKGQLSDNWSLLGSGMWLDAKNIRADTSIQGKRAYGSPRSQASVYLEYALPRVTGLVFSLGGQYVGNRPLESDNSNFVHGYHTFDLGARYTSSWHGHPLTYRLNLDNVTNEKYWLAAWESILNQGPPRVLRASVEVQL